MSEETYLSLWKGAIPVPPPPRPAPREIIRAVADYYGLTEQDLVGPKRTRDIAHARQAAMWALRKQTRLSFPRIGHFLGYRDHTTAMHGFRQHEKRLKAAEAAAQSSTVNEEPSTVRAQEPSANAEISEACS